MKEMYSEAEADYKQERRQDCRGVPARGWRDVASRPCAERWAVRCAQGRATRMKMEAGDGEKREQERWKRITSQYTNIRGTHMVQLHTLADEECILT